jgi:ATP-dependent Lon protease
MVARSEKLEGCVSEPDVSPPDRSRRRTEPARVALPTEVTLLPLLNVVIYPQTVTPLAIGQEVAVRLVDAAIAEQRLLGLVALHGATRPERIAPGDFFAIGTASIVHRMVRLHDNTLRVAVEGVARFEVLELLAREPALVARVQPLPDEPLDRTARTEARALVAAARALGRRLPAQGAAVFEELVNESDPQRLSFLAAARLLARGTLAERQHALELTRAAERLALLRQFLERDLAALDAKQ